MDDKLFRIGDNCWRREIASRGRFLIDASDYYEDLFYSLLEAKSQILICGWDLSDNISLISEKKALSQPNALAPLLIQLLDSKPDLQVHILIWDSFPIFFNSRKSWSKIRRAFKHPRLHLVGHRRLPQFCSYHQKLVVIDDSVAYAGGMDLTANRLDTPEHQDHGRVDPTHGRFIPIHDIQVRVEGDLAKSLGELAKKSWHWVTGEHQPSVDSDQSSNWIEKEFDFYEMPAAISRTRPEYEEQSSVQETRKLLTEIIKRAERYIYIEAQYLTSKDVVNALIEQLRNENGPEIIIVSSKNYFGVLEKNSLGILRNHRMRELKQADKYQRLGLYYPKLGSTLIVHSKLLIIDGKYVSIGSTNLCSRSLKFDFELNLIFDASHLAIGNHFPFDSLMLRLIAEHKDEGYQSIKEQFEASGSLIEMIHYHPKENRRLAPLHFEKEGLLGRLISKSNWADPEHGLMVSQRGLKKWVPLIFVALVVVLIGSLAREIQWSEVLNSISDYPANTIAIAIALSLVGHMVYSSFDILAKKYIGHRLSTAKTMVIAMVSYAFNLNLGSLIGGAGFRYRLYKRFGLSTGQISQIFAFGIATNWIGYFCLLGLILAAGIGENFGSNYLPAGTLKIFGWFSVAFIITFIGICIVRRNEVWMIRHYEFQLPSPAIAVAQVGLGILNWTMMSLVLFFLLGEQVELIQVLFALLMAGLAGIIIRVPAGIGVQEATFLLVLGPILPSFQILAAYLAYRGIYFLLPLIIASIFYLGLESNASRLGKNRQSTELRQPA